MTTQAPRPAPPAPPQAPRSPEHSSAFTGGSRRQGADGADGGRQTGASHLAVRAEKGKSPDVPGGQAPHPPSAPLAERAATTKASS
jgi:hypothetical protein